MSAASSSGGQTTSPPLKVFQLLRPLTIDWKTSWVFGLFMEGQAKPDTDEEEGDDGTEDGTEDGIEDEAWCCIEEDCMAEKRGFQKSRNEKAGLYI